MEIVHFLCTVVTLTFSAANNERRTSEIIYSTRINHL